MDNLNAHQFVPHHVLPREQGGPDELDNLLTVWNGPTGKGCAGCHGLIHTDRREAKRLGLLKDHEDKWVPKK